jgi:hypothetical protein
MKEHTVKAYGEVEVYMHMFIVPSKIRGISGEGRVLEVCSGGAVY